MQALDRSRRKVHFVLVGAPATAWLWAYTIGTLRAVEAGRLEPGLRGGLGALLEFAWFYFSVGMEGLVGRAGVHVLFGCLVAAAVGVGLWGSVQRRDLDRRGVTARAVRHERQARQQWLRAAVEQGEHEDASRQPPASARALGTLLQVFLLGWKLLPFASIGLTAFFSWKALAR